MWFRDGANGRLQWDQAYQVIQKLLSDDLNHLKGLE
jgi:hypothetical protein